MIEKTVTKRKLSESSVKEDVAYWLSKPPRRPGDPHAFDGIKKNKEYYAAVILVEGLAFQ